MFKKMLEAELIRYKKHPLFWSAVFGASMSLLYKMRMDLLCDRHNV